MSSNLASCTNVGQTRIVLPFSGPLPFPPRRRHRRDVIRMPNGKTALTTPGGVVTQLLEALGGGEFRLRLTRLRHSHLQRERQIAELVLTETELRALRDLIVEGAR